MQVRLSFNEDYPQEPPEAMFQPLPSGDTLFHPNVFDDGSVCLDLLKKKGDGGRWTPALTIKTVLVALQRFLEREAAHSPASYLGHSLPA